MPDDLLGTLQPPPPPIAAFSPLGQFGAGLSGFGAGLRGQLNPVLAQQQAQQDAQYRQQVHLLQLRQQTDRLRLEKSRLLLSIAKDLPDDNPDAVRKKLEIYNQSGLLRFSPEEMQSAEGVARGKQRLQQLPSILGGLQAGLGDADLEAFFPGVGRTFDLPTLRRMTPQQLEELGGPDLKGKLARATSESLKAQTDKIHADALTAIQAESEGKGRATPFQRALSGVGPKTPDELAGMLAVERATNPTRTFTSQEQSLLRQFDIDRKTKGETGLPRLAMLCAMGDKESCQALKAAKSYDLNALKVGLSGDVAAIRLKEQQGLALTDDDKRTLLQWDALTRGLKGPKPLPSTLRASLSQAKETVQAIATIEDILARHPEFKKRFGVIRGNSALVTFRFLGLNNQELTDLISATKNLFLAGGKQQFGARFTQSEMRLLNLAKPSLDQPFETFLANLQTWKSAAMPKYRALLKEGEGLGADLSEYELTLRPGEPSAQDPATRRALELLAPGQTR